MQKEIRKQKNALQSGMEAPPGKVSVCVGGGGVGEERKVKASLPQCHVQEFKFHLREGKATEGF